MIRFCFMLFALLCTAAVTPASARVSALSPAERQAWVRHLLPLPHEISLTGKKIIDPREISIVLRSGAGPCEKQAAKELSDLFVEKAGVSPAGTGFRIVMGVLDSRGAVAGVTVKDAGRLKTLPNADQAYLIRSEGNRIILAGLTEKGVYYAANTLRQFMNPYLNKSAAVIPVVAVTDWPDLNERGVWNFPNPDAWIPWMSSVKLNWGNMFITVDPIRRGEKNHAPIDRKLLLEGRARAFNYLPEILHLNFLAPYGLYRAYPELAGHGEGALAGRYFAHKEGDQHRAPCASNPLLAGILAEWMSDIYSQGAEEITCWLTERPAQCGCPACTAEGQFVWEARAFVNAWNEARKTCPGLKIRLFISTTTDERYHRVLAETPPEVRIERCCATTFERVRHAPRDLFANPLFDSHAAAGRWIATYDVPLTANGNVDTPEFKVPQSSPHRIRHYLRQKIERRWSAAYGMMAWGNATVRRSIDPAGIRDHDPDDMARRICGMDIMALAEWSWNLDGRSEREFAAAWATREGMEHPDAVAEWAEIMGPIEFDVYDSGFPTCYSQGGAAALVKERKRPVLGEGMFRYYASPLEFDRKIAAGEKALAIAKGFSQPDLANETSVVLSYIRLARHIYETADRVSRDDLRTIESQDALRETLKKLEAAGAENTEAIKRWRGALGSEPWGYRVYDAIKGTETTVRDIGNTIRHKYLY